MYNAITDVSGIEVGHWTDPEAATGCTVVLCRAGAVGGVDVRGSAPGSRETDLLRPTNLVQQAHAIVLSGGSAYGLDAATGAMHWLEEQGIGFDVGVGIVPIVPAAVLFDLTCGSPTVRPDAEAGRAACAAASSGAVAEGCVGAGTGATIGKLRGPQYAMKSGLGTASCRLGNGLVVGALVAVNALGDVVDPKTGQIVAGARTDDGGFLNTAEAMLGDLSNTMFSFSNTTIAVVATNAALNKEQANKVAQMAHDGLAMAIRPVHTMFDGDTVFCLATGQPEATAADTTVIGNAAAQVLAQAVIRAATQAESLAGYVARRDLSAKDNEG